MKNSKEVYPRKQASQVLVRVLVEGKALDEAIESVLPSVPRSMIHWLQDVCSGVIRWKGRLDQIIDAVAVKKKPTGNLRRALLLATYQLVAQDRVHPGAVVSETVAEIKAREGEFPAKFANACLRKIADQASEWRNLRFPEGQSPEVQAAWASFPVWFWNKIVSQHGIEWAKHFAAACFERPSLWIRTKQSDWQPEWALGGSVPGAWKAQEGGPIFEKDGFQEGKFIVQDISSQVLIDQVSKQVREGLSGTESLTALDLCAAPGGKALGLAWNGFQVTATDKNLQRMELLQKSVERAGGGVQIASWPPEGGIHFDLVWVDAPCSGTGIIRRHPDIKWLRKQEELEGLRRVQNDLLLQGWNHVKPGGYLVYSVCSVLKEEGIELVDSAQLAGAISLEQWSLAPHIDPFGDGFFSVLLKKQHQF